MSVHLAFSALFNRVFSGLSSTQQHRILIIGVDSGGKTTLLYRMKLGQIVTTIPTIGFNVETLKTPVTSGKTLDMLLWDVGGCDKIRPLWRHYFQNTEGLLLVHDATDRELFPELLTEISRLMTEFDNPQYGGRIVPFLLSVNVRVLFL